MFLVGFRQLHVSIAFVGVGEGKRVVYMTSRLTFTFLHSVDEHTISD